MLTHGPRVKEVTSAEYLVIRERNVCGIVQWLHKGD